MSGIVLKFQTKRTMASCRRMSRYRSVRSAVDSHIDDLRDILATSCRNSTGTLETVNRTAELFESNDNTLKSLRTDRAENVICDIDLSSALVQSSNFNVPVCKDDHSCTVPYDCQKF